MALTLAEVQREPQLLSLIKQSIDERRTADRFLLTGSANLLLMRGISESLAAAARADGESDRAGTANGEEVDLVFETAGRLLPIEVKATTRPRLGDAANLRSFRAEYRDTTRSALLLHTGDRLEWLSPGVLAAPWWRVV